MTDDQEAKNLLVGSATSKYVEDIIWSYCPGEDNPNYPKNLFIHETKRDEWILQYGEIEKIYSSFEETLKALISFTVEYFPNAVASRMLTDDKYGKFVIKAGL